MQPISPKDKKMLLARKQVCDKCFQPGIEFHYVFIYAGSQIPDWFNIVFACKQHHAEATPHNNKYKKETRKYFEHLIVVQHLKKLKLKLKFPKRKWEDYLC